MPAEPVTPAVVVVLGQRPPSGMNRIICILHGAPATPAQVASPQEYHEPHVGTQAWRLPNCKNCECQKWGYNTDTALPGTSWVKEGCSLPHFL